jgi:(1->4)-alpha-D-glucan 1-alpha-D-glucosylmutase
MKTEFTFPVATYRVQLNESFTLVQLEGILDYLEQLGITTIYASPIFDAVPGSMHGYDGIHPHRINPAIGTLDDLRRISALLKKKGMSWIQDIVPNHMALHPGNTWLMDVLERGPVSPWYHFFDIDWEYPGASLHGRLMIPFLDKPLAEALAAKQIQLVQDNGSLHFRCGELLFPFSAPAYDILLEGMPDIHPSLRETLAKLQLEIKQPLGLEEWTVKKQLLLRNDAAIITLLEQVNAHEALMALLLEHQYYLFTDWKETAHIINYRRFFTVNSLITLRMEDKQVFDTWHAFLYTLYEEGLIQGLRIDHIDGLLEPATYTHRLRDLFGEQLYIICEKILAATETLPTSWRINGTTGYEFLADINHLLTHPGGDEKISRFYRAQFPDLAKYRQLVLNKKAMILQTQMGGEWNNLLHLLFQYKLAPKSADHQKLKAALGLFMVCMPVYRIYPEGWPLSDAEAGILETAVTAALQRAPALVNELGLIRSWWQEDYALPAACLKFLKRLMQFTGPLTAKGVEDTVFYVYNALLSHNEVGDAPTVHKCTPAIFHGRSRLRQQQYPGALNTTATHDTKRGEDARIRLNVLTLLPDQWIQQVQQWHAAHEPFRQQLPDGRTAPAANDEYFIYQSILSGFPANNDVEGDFVQRLSGYIIKALREAKENSNWSSPDEAYEKSCLAFIQHLFSPGNDFIKSIQTLLEKVNPLAAVFSLSQLLLKITSPGVPDIYQGGELWDYSFVDPDNRRPVDYEDRRNMLLFMQQLEQDDPLGLQKLLQENRRFGWEKMFVCSKALQFRKAHQALFLHGSYVPVHPGQDNVIAYMRICKKEYCLVIVPLVQAVLPEVSLQLPDYDGPLQWRNIFTGEVITLADNQLPLSLLQHFPVALLEPVS